MLSLGFLQRMVDVLIELIFDAVDVLFGEQLGEHHRGLPPQSRLFLFLNLILGVSTATWGHSILSDREVNLYVAQVLENMLHIGSALGPELLDLSLFHQHPVSLFALLILLEFLIKSSQQVGVYVLEQLTNVVLNVRLHICRKVFDKLIIFKCLRIES
jgi:hypothetical protein